MLIGFNVSAQKELLQNGPMLGYATMHEVMIWVQTKKAADVKIAYYEKKAKKKLWSNTVKTKKKDAYTAHLIADKIKPDTRYFYDVYINGHKIKLGFVTSFKTKTIWRWRTEPPEFSFATGSGAYFNDSLWDRPGKPYGKDYQIYEKIYQKKPDFMLWLGDNVYLRQNEWNSWTGIVYRYTHDRKTPELQKLLANVYQYAILDDHDMGPNDCDGSYAFKDISIKAFEDFWANPPQIPGLKSATCYFNWNDVDFFLLDNRYYRSPDHLLGNDKTELGKKQLQWLKKALVFSKADFKIVAMGGQFLTTAANYETYSNFGFNKEREDLINFILEQNIKNVVFLTGDRHFTELSIMKNHNRPSIYDLTVSAFTSGSNTHAFEESNKYRLKNTVVMKHNFAVIKFSGARNNRKMTITDYDANGKMLWQKIFEKE